MRQLLTGSRWNKSKFLMIYKDTNSLAESALSSQTLLLCKTSFGLPNPFFGKDSLLTNPVPPKPLKPVLLPFVTPGDLNPPKLLLLPPLSEPLEKQKEII